MMNLPTLFIVTIALMFLTGIYSLLVTRNLMRVLISLEVLTKAAMLLIIAAGYLTNQTAMAQEFVITIIIIEVVVIAVAAGIVVALFRHTDSLDTKSIKNLKG